MESSYAAKKEKLMSTRSVSKDKDENTHQHDNLAKLSNVLPRRVRNRLHNLFEQIEDEFTEMYNENDEMRKTISALNEKLQSLDQSHADKNEIVPTNGLDNFKQANIKGKSSGISSSQLSQ
uniref:Uncharacterized protein n=1 Tax=Ciona savignyi TaxID=51511 RepID=H2Y9F7_CIOSA